MSNQPFKAKGTFTKTHLAKGNENQFEKYGFFFSGVSEGNNTPIEAFMNSKRPIRVFDNKTEQAVDPATYDNKELTGTVCFYAGQGQGGKYYYNVVSIAVDSAKEAFVPTPVKNPLLMTDDEINLGPVPVNPPVNQSTQNTSAVEKSVDAQQEAAPQVIQEAPKSVEQTPVATEPSASSQTFDDDPFGSSVPF